MTTDTPNDQDEYLSACAMLNAAASIRMSRNSPVETITLDPEDQDD